MTDLKGLVARLRASLRMDAINGDSMERSVCAKQMREAADAVERVIAENLQRGNVIGRISAHLLGRQNNVSDEDVVIAAAEVGRELQGARERAERDELLDRHAKALHMLVDVTAERDELKSRLAVENAESMRQYNEMGLRIDLERAEAERDQFDRDATRFGEALNEAWNDNRTLRAERDALRALLVRVRATVDGTELADFLRLMDEIDEALK